jgi:N-acetylmuramic acid 6-phosphate etherase
MMHWTGLEPEEGESLLAAHQGNLRAAVLSYNDHPEDYLEPLGK